MLILLFLKIKKKGRQRKKEKLDNPFSVRTVNQVCNGQVQGLPSHASEKFQ